MANSLPAPLRPSSPRPDSSALASPHPSKIPPGRTRGKRSGGGAGERLPRKERGGAAENPRITLPAATKCVDLGDIPWRVPAQSARVAAQTARVSRFSARVAFLPFAYLSLSQLIEKREIYRATRIGKRLERAARVDARVMFELRGLDSAARLNPRTSAHLNSQGNQSTWVPEGATARVRGLFCLCPPFFGQREGLVSL